MLAGYKEERQENKGDAIHWSGGASEGLVENQLPTFTPGVNIKQTISFGKLEKRDGGEN